MRKEITFINLALDAALLTGCARSYVPAGTEAPTPNQNTNTAEVTPNSIPTLPPLPEITLGIENKPLIPETPIVEPNRYDMFGIDFANSETPIDMGFTLDSGKNFKIRTFKSLVCESGSDDTLFAPGNHYACSYKFETGNTNSMLLLTHSGWMDKTNKLEAEDIRHYLEDKSAAYLYDARLTPDQIQVRLNQFVGSEVKIKQGDFETKLTVKYAVRVPPNKLGPFSHADTGLTNEDIIDTLAGIDPNVAQIKKDGKPYIVVVFCGWRNEAESNLIISPLDELDEYDAVRYAFVLGE